MISGILYLIFLPLSLSEDSKVHYMAAILFLAGFFAAIKVKPSVDRFFIVILALLPICVLDTILSSMAVTDQGTAAPPVLVEEPITYGIISIGWMIGAAVSGLILDNR